MRNTQELRNYFLGKDPQLKETMADNSLRLIGIDGKYFVLRTELVKRLNTLKKYVDDKDLELLSKIGDLETSLGVVDTEIGKINQKLFDHTAEIGELEFWKNNTDFVLEDDLAAALSDYYDKEEVDELLNTIPKFHILVVDELPETNISTSTIYLVPKGGDIDPAPVWDDDPPQADVYNEYIYVIPEGQLIGDWELIGSTDMDLSNYYTKSQTNTLLDGRVDVTGDTMTGELSAPTISVGQHLETRGAQLVCGTYNIKDDASAAPTGNTMPLIVGNGTGSNAKSNAHTVDWSGNGWYAGDVYVGSTSGTHKDTGSKKLASETVVDQKIIDAEPDAIPIQDIIDLFG